MGALGNVAAIVAAVTALAVAAGGYIQFVLKRSVLPSAEFDVDFTAYARGDTQLIGEMDLIFRNAGTTTLIVTGVRSRGRYRCRSDGEVLQPDLVEPQFTWKVGLGGVQAGLSQPSSSVSSSIPSSVAAAPPAALPGWLPVVSDRTFIQPGVTQHYRKPVSLPADAQLVHIWASFDYYIEMSRATRFLIRWLAAPPKTLDWRCGISNHTVRRTFLIPVGLPTLKSDGGDGTTGQ